MNKQRLNRIEDKVKETTTPKLYYPYSGWMEEGYLYIVKTPFILERLEGLGREIVVKWMGYPGIKVDPEDKDIVEKITEDYFTLVGMDKPIKYFTINWVDGASNN